MTNEEKNQLLNDVWKDIYESVPMTGRSLESLNYVFQKHRERQIEVPKPPEEKKV